MPTDPVEHYPSITVGVITHDKRTEGFKKLLQYLAVSIKHYPGDCELIVGNNGGEDVRSVVQEIIQSSDIESVCSCKLLDSPENNIAVGRNLVLDDAQFGLLAFIDDDEYPVAEWLDALVDALFEYQCAVVAGPVEAVFHESTLHWISSMDLHNIRFKQTGDKIQYAGTGNVLLNLELIGDQRFDREYGKSGGSDTEYFSRILDAGLAMRWCSEAKAYEDIPLEKSTARYTIRRCLSQGATMRRVLQGRGNIPAPTRFIAKALVLFVLSLLIAVPLIIVKHDRAGDWMKRAFSNLGKVRGPASFLYQ